MKFLLLLVLVLAGCQRHGCIVDMDPTQGVVVLQNDDGIINQFEVGGFEVRQFKIGDNITLLGCADSIRCVGGIVGNGRCQGSLER